jgi:hypothetical protein
MASLLQAQGKLAFTGDHANRLASLLRTLGRAHAGLAQLGRSQRSCSRSRSHIIDAVFMDEIADAPELSGVAAAATIQSALTALQDVGREIASTHGS